MLHKKNMINYHEPDLNKFKKIKNQSNHKVLLRQCVII